MRLAAVAAALAILAAGAQEQKFRSGIDAVRVDALVTEGNRVVTGLKAADFELRDNGILQAINHIEIESMPVAVTFVLDTSGSVAGERMTHLSSAIDIVLKGLREQDRVGLVTFSHRVWQRVPLTSDTRTIRGVLSAATAAGGTSLHDAVYAGLALSESQQARSLVLVFSDGMDNSSWLGHGTVERAARRADAVVYGVAVAAATTPYYPFRPEYLSGQTDFLEAVASVTGGRVIKADQTANLPKAFEEILQEFRTRYVITYSAAGVGTLGWHTIDLKVKGRRADVKARRGYERTEKF